MFPHIDVHRWRNDDWGSCREIKRSEEIIGHALGKLCQNIGCGGDNEQRINGLRNSDVLDRRIDVWLGTGIMVEHAGNDLFSRERGESEGPNELLRGARHNHLNADALVLQETNNLGRFVGGNTAANSKGDFHTEQ